MMKHDQKGEIHIAVMLVMMLGMLAVGWMGYGHMGMGA